MKLNLSVKNRDRFFATASCGLLFLMVAFALLKPSNNWDSIPYTGCLLELKGTPQEALRAQTYAEVGDLTTPELYQLMVSSDLYRQTVATDSEAFHEQLHLYRNRALYIAAASVLHRMGVHPVRSLYLVSWMGGLAAFCLLSLVFLTNQRPFTWFVFLVGAIAIGAATVLRLATPDALAALGWAIVTWCYFKKRAAVLIVAPFLPLLRPDLIIASLLFSCVVALTERGFLRSLASAAVSILVFVTLQSVTGAADWPTYFHVTFIERLAYPESTQITMSASNYLKTLWSGLRALEYRPHMLISVFLFLLNVKQSGRGFKLGHQPLTTLSICFILIHYALFPVGDLRFYLGPNIILIGSLFQGGSRNRD